MKHTNDDDNDDDDKRASTIFFFFSSRVTAKERTDLERGINMTSESLSWPQTICFDLVSSWKSAFHHVYTSCVKACVVVSRSLLSLEGKSIKVKVSFQIGSRFPFIHSLHAINQKSKQGLEHDRVESSLPIFQICPCLHTYNSSLCVIGLSQGCQ